MKPFESAFYPRFCWRHYAAHPRLLYAAPRHALFERSLSRMIEAEKQVSESTKKAAGSIRKSANELGDTMQRLLKTADIDRLERYATVLERMATAMQALATLEIDGKLDRIVSAIR